jgi:hypothetical protein
MLSRLQHEQKLLKGEFNEDCTTLTVSKSVVFHLSKNYPFHPPTLRIHNKEYVSYLTDWYRTLSPLLKKYNVAMDCLCCTTLTCMWSPCNTCKQMYDEYISYRDKLRVCMCLSYISKLPFDDNVGEIIASFIV